MNKPANEDSISRVLPKKTNLCFLEALESLRFLLGRGCPRLGQPIEKPISPRPSGTGIFPYSRMPALKRRPIFKAPLRGASTDDGAIETGFPEGDLSFSVRSTRLNIDNYFFRFPRKGLMMLSSGWACRDQCFQRYTPRRMLWA